MKVSDFTKRQLYHLQAFCNFTPVEEQLFILRSKNTTLEDCAEHMNMSVQNVYRINKKMKSKIEQELLHMQ